MAVYTLRCKDDELERWRSCAAKDSRSLAQWMRLACERAATVAPIPKGADLIPLVSQGTPYARGHAKNCSCLACKPR